MKLFHSILALLIIVSCNNNITSDQAQDTHPSLALKEFTAIPDTIEGCVGLFSLDRDAFENENFVYASKLQEHCIIHLDSHTVLLKYSSSKDNKKSHTETFENETYLLKITMTMINPYDEGGIYEGYLELLDKTNNTVQKHNVYGESGC